MFQGGNIELTLSVLKCRCFLLLVYLLKWEHISWCFAYFCSNLFEQWAMINLSIFLKWLFPEIFFPKSHWKREEILFSPPWLTVLHILSTHLSGLFFPHYLLRYFSRQYIINQWQICIGNLLHWYTDMENMHLERQIANCISAHLHGCNFWVFHFLLYSVMVQKYAEPQWSICFQNYFSLLHLEQQETKQIPNYCGCDDPFAEAVEKELFTTGWGRRQAGDLLWHKHKWFHTAALVLFFSWPAWLGEKCWIQV